MIVTALWRYFRLKHNLNLPIVARGVNAVPERLYIRIDGKEDARQPGNPGTLNKNCLNSGPPLSYAQHNTCIAWYKMHTHLFKPPPFS